MGILSKFIGNTGEKYAENFLKTKGYTIIATQHKEKYVEIDIIAEKNHELYLFEVKTVSHENIVSYETEKSSVSQRNKNLENNPSLVISERISRKKLNNLHRFGEYYLNKHEHYLCVVVGVILVKLVEDREEPTIEIVFV